MCRELLERKPLGVAGVVIGVNTADARGRMARDRLDALVALARPLTLTFHRAFDALADPFAASQRP